MAAKKKQTCEKPKLANTKPKIVLNGGGNKSKVDAGNELRVVPDDFFSIPEMLALHEDERRFVEEYILDRNGVRAYFRAGLKATSYGHAGVQAHLLLKRDKVKAAIKRAMEILSDSVVEDLNTIALNFKQIRDQSMEPIPLFDKLGHPTGFYRFDGANAISANKEFGLALGLLRNKVEMTGKDGKAIEMNVKVEGQISLTLSDLGSLSLPARKEVLAMLEAKENGNGKHE